MVLLILILWVGYDFHTAQSVPLEKETIWVTFLHVVWYDKAAARPVRNVSSQRGDTETLLCLLVIHICTLASRAREERGWGSQSYKRLFVN